MSAKELKRSDFEIMAPVGSYESLHAAIQGGADSVYLGIEQLNMRSRSSNNFSTEDLRKIVGIAKENGIKTYLTVNTVIFNEELALMREIIDVAKDTGVTAVIASDQAAINYAHQNGVEVHISTQVNISNIETLKFYSNFADVVVLARELNMDQVKAIHQAIIEEDIRGPKGELIQIEMFAHGALCMATSGKCYISLHQLNSSANRGGCLQPCRRGYSVTEKESGMEMDLENEYIMSPKDLKTIHFANKMIDAGVRVFKIEGRARSAEYVKTVSECYNEAILAVLDDSYNQEKIDVWDKRLSEVFNRGFWDGYYLGQKLGEWSHSYGSKATKKKTYIGKGMNYFPKLNVAEFLVETHSLKIGDEILITGPTTGVIQMKVAELRVDLKPVEETKKGERFSMPVEAKIRRSDKLYKLTDTLNNQ
ncbi:peptidase U32 family protein [Carboxylicivirga sp. N1Y90]|uniref:peptidase U32 family protein n=1 Tax=Carboxylicivirga fragile TaxID=3417571 RepID=UPI003D32FC72|nr:U32 family peptidase [Marinilabiliaceae bacterium N1Y90]